MLFPLILLATSVSGWLVMVSVAVDDPGFAVEPDYYKKAADFDNELARRAESRGLSYQVVVENFVVSPAKRATVRLRLADSAGAPLDEAQVSAEVLPIARAFDVQEVTFQNTASGIYEASWARPRRGLWEVRLVVTTNEGTFRKILRTELASLEASKGEPPS
jgi:hypothetical protein